MSRILLAWELGGNYGHLSRLVPLARRLSQKGHRVLLAIRDVRLGAELCRPHGLPYVQAPLAHPLKPNHAPPASYAEILLCEGFADELDSQGRVDGWINLYDTWSPHLVVLDHAPTALFAARLARVPTLAISSGFEAPPNVSPFPCIRPWENISPYRLATAEERVLTLLNKMARGHGGQAAQTLAEIFCSGPSVFLTFPELDHYGARPDARYIGPVSSPFGIRTGWPEHAGRRIFAYLRSCVPGSMQLLRVLHGRDENVLCFMPDVPKELSETCSRPGLRFLDRPIDFSALLPSADLVVTYGGSGIVSASFLAGVPMLLIPRNVEQYLVAKRVEELGAGWLMEQSRSEKDFSPALASLFGDDKYASNARTMARRYEGHSAAASLELLVEYLESSVLPDGPVSGGRGCPGRL